MGTPLRILHVEDSEDDAFLVQRELSLAGFEPSVTRVDTLAALRLALEGGSFDAVFCDYALPGFEGSTALPIVRAWNPDLPFIFLSGTCGEETAIDALKAGATDYVMKHRLARLGPVLRRALVERERKRAHLATFQQETFLLAALPVGLYRLRASDRMPVWVSAQIERLSGFTSERFLREPGFWASRLRPVDLDRVVGELSASLDRGTAVSEYRWRRADDRERWFADHVTLVRDENGRPREILGIWEDITERKSLEERSRQSQKVESLGLLAGGVAHDFNNLLNAILGFSELLLLKLPSDSTLRPYAESIQQAGESAASLTRQLLAFGRKQVLEPEVLDLRSVVSELRKLLLRTLGEHIELLTPAPAELGKVHADRAQMEQVLMNLAVNARDAMPNGGRLTISTSDIRLDEAYARERPGTKAGPHVLLEVTDTGIGMDAETQARLFEPFFTTKPAGRGTGLGLATVYGVVKQSGGSIWVYSEVGKGSVFKVYLPRTEDAGASKETSRARAVDLDGKETLLLVDDSDVVRSFLRTLLADHGYAVLEAEHPLQALQVLEGHAGPIHLLISDVVMPGMNGPELAGRVAAQRPNMKVLFMSGYPGGALTPEGTLDPSTPFLQKPVAAAALLRKVREILEPPAVADASAVR
ncbi:MAG: response regulator [Planctomycetes bacterium]|nr:response regulator [Planctomycetota bacterium]